MCFCSIYLLCVFDPILSILSGMRQKLRWRQGSVRQNQPAAKKSKPSAEYNLWWIDKEKSVFGGQEKGCVVTCINRQLINSWLVVFIYEFFMGFPLLIIAWLYETILASNLFVPSRDKFQVFLPRATWSIFATRLADNHHPIQDHRRKHGRFYFEDFDRTGDTKVFGSTLGFFLDTQTKFVL